MATQPKEEVTQVQVLEAQRGHLHSCEGDWRRTVRRKEGTRDGRFLS